MTLPHDADASDRGSAPKIRSRVQSQGTTATPAGGNGKSGGSNPEGSSQWDPTWAADLEYVWRVRVAPQIEHWRDRARAAKRSGNRTSEQYARDRARALALPRADVVDACRGRWRTIGCGCGRREIPVGCDQPQLCAWCSKRHWWKWRRRIRRGLEAALAAARAQWAQNRVGMRPGIYLVTLTTPHSGDLGRDREQLGAAWRKLSKVAQRERWWSTYAAVYECTPGTDGGGHLHLHVAAISSWIPYDELHAAWRDALDVDVAILDVRAPGQRGAEGAANYLAKYVTKGVQLAGLSGAKAAELLVAQRNRRKVTTSRHFWDDDPCCRDCGRRWYLAAAPPGLLRHRPAAVLRSLAEQHGVWLARGSPQVEIELLA